MLIPFIPKCDRLKCHECKKPMPFIAVTKKSSAPDIKVYMEESKQKTGEYYYGGYGFFCTMTCATRFANRVVKKEMTRANPVYL